MIAPKGTQSITILMVEKEKQILLQSFQCLGLSGFYRSNDKFLVQSSVASSTSVQSRKLFVRHMVEDFGTGGSSGAVWTPSATKLT